CSTATRRNSSGWPELRGRWAPPSGRSARMTRATQGSSGSSRRKPARGSRRAFSAAACASTSARRERTWPRTRSAFCSRRMRSAQKGRGSRIPIATPDGAATLIDESYNANPASMRAALKLLGAAKPGPNGRRIAVIGDMLELGPDGASMHAELAADLEANRVDLLFGAGPLTRALYDAAPASMRAAWAERSGELAAALAGALRAGDVAMVKGSNGSRMGPLVAALREHFARTSVEQGVRC